MFVAFKLFVILSGDRDREIDGFVERLDVGAIAFAVVRCGSRLVESYIWLVVFGARIFLSPTRIASVFTPTPTE